MRKRLFQILLVALITSCDNHGKEEYADSMLCESEHLSSEILNDNFIFASPKKLLLSDTLLLALDTRCGDHLFYAFSASKGTFLKGGGKKGEGPGEVIFPKNAHLRNQSLLSYWDMDKREIVQYDIKKLLADSTVYFSTLKLDKQITDPLLDVIPLAEGYLYNGNGDKHIGLTKCSSHLEAPDLPGTPSTEINRAIMNKAHWALSPNEKRLIRATPIGGIVQCFSLKENQLEQLWIKLYFPPIYKLVEGVIPTWITWCEDSQMGFDDLYVTDHHVYLLLNGKFARERPFANEILVLDWDGNLERKFILDKTVNTIAVDETKKLIYATSCGMGTEPHIITFHF